ncbi:glycyl-tRNA synthetase [Aureococcus anophagefferens]|uniref:Glycyl-tRNA synthetase n=1 Tax=Aureococcus anophagefferens TaxID=44056 RepID=A0ABR1G864_AURAN
MTVLLSLASARALQRVGGRARSLCGRGATVAPEAETAPAPAPSAYVVPKMEEVVSLCKKRGFVFGSSEIYNGFNGFYDYGPLGSELKRNIKERWWRDMVRDDASAASTSSIIAGQDLGAAHVGGFSDPMVDDKTTKKRYRADQLFYAELACDDGSSLGCVTVFESEDTEGDAYRAGKKLAKKAGKTLSRPLVLKCLEDAADEDRPRIPPPDAPDRPGDLTAPRDFNLMFQTSVGAAEDNSAAAYLRPETAQGIFVNFKNVASTARGFKLPYGIGQIGKAFRNEITPRNFIFRSREFEQMEIEYFLPPGDDAWRARARAVDRRLPGLARAPGHRRARSFDLKQHTDASGKSLEYFDDGTKEKYLPQVIEPSIGVDRLFLAVVCSAFEEDEVNGEKRSVLKFHPAMAPVKVAILPLVKKDAGINDIAAALYGDLKKRYNCQLDAAGNIGRRYRRQDEIGTPLCVTVDFDSLDDGAVTVRDRDTTDQVRLKIEDVALRHQARRGR